MRPESKSNWMVQIIRKKLLAVPMAAHLVDDWFEMPHSVFGNMTPEAFVDELIRVGNAQSYADGWHEVLAAVERIYN